MTARGVGVIPLGLAALTLYGVHPRGSSDLFVDVTEVSGLNFRHFNGAEGSYYLPEIMGSGVALLDYDNDGDLDIFLVQGKAYGRAQSPQEGHRLFRNELTPSGKLRFTDVSKSSGVRINTQGMGVAAGDYDNDGWIDLFVTGVGEVLLLRNKGDGSFSNETERSGITNKHWSTSASWLDYDRDGDLDLYVANYVDFSVATNKRCYAAGGEPDYCSPSVYSPVSDRLYRNEGEGRFTDVTLASGIANATGPGLGVISFDFNQDGWPDIYVANDGAPNLLWRNRQGQSFEDVALETGVALNTDGMSQAGMGVDAGDFRRTGFDDLLVTNLRHETYNLYTYDPKGFYVDRAIVSGLARSTYPHTGFGVRFFDFDHDGWLDVFLANGSVTRRPELRGERFPYHETNQLLRSQAGGHRLSDVSAQAGRALAVSESSRGLAIGDVDNDGDLDAVIANNNGPARLLLNRAPPSGTVSVSVRLEGIKSNCFGIGARVALHRTGQTPQWRRVQVDGSYLSSSDTQVHFGLGVEPVFDRLEVIWPSGRRESWNSRKNTLAYRFKEGTGTP